MKFSKGVMVVMTGQKISSNIYKLLGNTIVGGVAALAESKNDDIFLWHISERGMRELHKRNLLAGIKSCKLDLCKLANTVLWESSIGCDLKLSYTRHRVYWATCIQIFRGQ
jgi:hypothetical protein